MNPKVYLVVVNFTMALSWAFVESVGWLPVNGTVVQMRTAVIVAMLLNFTVYVVFTDD